MNLIPPGSMTSGAGDGFFDLTPYVTRGQQYVITGGATEIAEFAALYNDGISTPIHDGLPHSFTAGAAGPIEIAYSGVPYPEPIEVTANLEAVAAPPVPPAQVDPQALVTASRCFSCIPKPTQFEIQTYIIATVSGLGTNAKELARLSRCLSCLSIQTLQEIKSYLLAVLAGFSTDPTALAARAKCFTCIPQGAMSDVQTYLLALDPNGPGISDPNELSKAAVGFQGVSPSTLLEIQVYLLATNAGVSTDPNVLANLARCFSCLPYPVLTSVVTDIINFLEDGTGDTGGGGGVGGCTDVPADQIPVITPHYTAGVLSTIDILFPQVCCSPGTFTILESDNADMSGSTDIDIIPIGGAAGEQNYEVLSVDVSAATKAYLAVVQTCFPATVSGLSNIAIRYGPQTIPVGGMAYDSMESYANGAQLNNLYGGTFWSGVYVAGPDEYFDAAYDSMESYANGAALAGLNGGTGWNGPYAN